MYLQTSIVNSHYGNYNGNENSIIEIYSNGDINFEIHAYTGLFQIEAIHINNKNRQMLGYLLFGKF